MKKNHNLLGDNRGQHTVEFALLIALLVVALAASLHSFLPYLAEGFDGMAKAILGPTP